ncbi:NAD-dependent epimerase/dehydratase family protein [Crocosphaera sp. XPORK-15E]|uniref:NAD-dependent epimerase/dehydratase family protein n=1 Tax=Crocosphaera sp. XPORK-15E TaxID=3110247 RepID=UPI002B1F8950|nr:NAD-dependent epimerase/dehydratase family protein [Crocosphaera sp. XPORK-15E]MEA5536088.1 NAD-dependent epimerase/dehydratase family protein [Crocosphaera sp. XPORK-15E]
MSESKTILITGVAGFLGRYIARHFFEEHWTVIGIDNSSPENAPLSYLAKYDRFHLPNTGLSSLLQEYSPRVCVHCAGRASVGLSISDPAADFYGNSVITFEMLNALRVYAPNCRFIFLSSAAVYGNPASLPVSESQPPAPLSPYGFHKWQGEQLCLEFAQVYSLPTASLRIFSAYGAGLRRQVIWDICQKALTEHKLILKGTGQESRDFIHAFDIAKAVHLVATSAVMKGEVYNLGSGREATITVVATLIVQALGISLDLQFDGIVPPGTPRCWKASITKLQELGFSPSIPLEKGIESFISWSRAELVGF